MTPFWTFRHTYSPAVQIRTCAWLTVGAILGAGRGGTPRRGQYRDPIECAVVQQKEAPVLVALYHLHVTPAEQPLHLDFDRGKGQLLALDNHKKFLQSRGFQPYVLSKNIHRTMA